MGFLDLPPSASTRMQAVVDPSDADALLITVPPGVVITDPSDADAIIITT